MFFLFCFSITYNDILYLFKYHAQFLSVHNKTIRKMQYFLIGHFIRGTLPRNELHIMQTFGGA